MALHVAKLSVAHGRRLVIHGASPEPFLRGTLTALIGPNAAGKSSFLRALAGLLPSRGAIRLRDADVARLRTTERVRRLRYVPQAYATTAALTVFDTVLLALKQRGFRGADDEAAAAAILARLGIADLSARPVGALSGGQQQLVAIAQGLVVPAPVLLLDEPTSALDLHRQLQVLALLQRIAAEREAIVIVALHDLSLAGRHADRIVLLRDGAIAADGAPEAVLSSACCAAAYGVSLAVERNSRGSLMVEAHL